MAVKKERVVVYLEQDLVKELERLREVRRDEKIEEQIKAKVPPSKRIKKYPLSAVIEEVTRKGLAWSGVVAPKSKISDG